MPSVNTSGGLAGRRGCPPWCAMHEEYYDTDGSPQVAHSRPVSASTALHADVEWLEDCRAPGHPERFEDEPALVLRGAGSGRTAVVLPITPEVIAGLEAALDAARCVLAMP